METAKVQDVWEALGLPNVQESLYPILSKYNDNHVPVVEVVNDSGDLSGKFLLFRIRETDKDVYIAPPPIEQVDPRINKWYVDMVDMGFPAHIEWSRPDSHVRIKRSPMSASNAVTQYVRYCKRSMNELFLRHVSFEEMVALGRDMYADNMDYHKKNHPRYVYPESIDECPETAYYGADDGFKHFALMGSKEAVAVVTYSVHHRNWLWSRTLRSFREEHQRYRPGHAATFALMQLAWEAKGQCELNLGLEIPYKPQVWTPKTPDAPWEYFVRFGANLVVGK